MSYGVWTIKKALVGLGLVPANGHLNRKLALRPGPLSSGLGPLELR